MLEIRNLVSGYASAAVLRDINISVNTGEIVAVLGPNGAGKTTLLSTIFGRIAPFSGEIDFAGRKISGMAPHVISAMGIGYVPDNRGLAPSLTVDENLRIISKWKSDPYELFPELKSLGDRRTGLLSGGEQQMLAVARALVSGPTILMVDELSFGLAPILVTRLFERLRGLADSGEVGVVLVEQQVNAALAVADRAYVLSHGELVLHCPAEQLLEDPELLKRSYLGGDAVTDRVDVPAG